ncbi:M42 family peptidase [Pseudomonas sp. v388]|uniref:M42 family peptidase n=1 Tax=Pseudomonas sp. v388 TaxID=2479849 RepID=UPI000F7BAD68|nr:M42 family peptidase [Pseudomonas sp. v388]RRV10559.1 M42 family peptidase [Pseudomonas sp. v388]
MTEETLLEQLLMARGPGGEEFEVREVCRKELQQYCDETWIDDAGNLVGLIRAQSAKSDGAGGLLVMAHLDEIAMTVKRINDDGTLQVVALGGANPVNFGMCPVDILGDTQECPGVLSFGSMHLTADSKQGRDVQTGNVYWEDVHVVTRLCREQLEAAGIRPGTRVVMSRHWRKPFPLQDAVAAHFLDDRAPVLAVLNAAAQLFSRRSELKQDVYLAFTTMEEETNAGALFAARHLSCRTAIAVEVGPIAEEYGTVLSANPIIVAGDEKGHYSRQVTDALITAVRDCGYEAQVALLIDFASDASAILSVGVMGKVGCIAIPTENTHGFEVVLRDGIAACSSTLVQLLTGDLPV